MLAVFRQLLSAALVGLFVLAGFANALACCSTPEGVEEFVGPFANSLNLQTGCGAAGAVGNGTTDDTAAVQACFSAVNSTTPWLWIPHPSVCYKITSTVTYSSLYGIFYGESPANTSFCWRGASGGTMFRPNGAAYNIFGRVTFNGANGASPPSILLDQNWDNVAGTFDTGNMYLDDVFETAAYGIRCGVSGQGCAETVPMRSTFTGLTTAGIAMGNQNALDMFAWYDTFSGNFDAMQNTLASGGFHAFESYFTGNTDADIAFNSTTGFDFRWNTSIGSATFIKSGANGNPCTVNLQGNLVLDWTNSSNAIVIGCHGPVVMLDNVFRALGGNTTQPVYLSLSADSVFGVGNKFTDTGGAAPYAVTSGETIAFGDTTVTRASLLGLGAPTLPATPQNNSRTITEETASRTSSQIQGDINTACSGGTTRPVIHFQAGSYSNISLSIPANCDVQLIGDGHNSMLQGTGSACVTTLSGPNFTTWRDLYINGNGGCDMTMSGVDQPGARLFMESVTPSSNTVNVAFNGLQNLTVEAHNWFDENAGTTSIIVTGPTGQWLGSQFSVFAGATSANPISYQVSGNGHLIVRDVWNDTGGGPVQRLNLTGNGSVTFSGGQNNMSVNGALPTFQINNFSGNFALLGSLLDGNNVSITGNNTGSNILIDGQNFVSGTDINNYENGGNYAFLENMNGITTYQPDGANYTSESFLLTVLSQARAQQPSIPGNPTLPSGATDIRMYKVWLSNGTGLSINP